MPRTTPGPPANNPDAPGAPRSGFAPLYVLEGPDGVGKSELVRQVVALLRETGADVLDISFPGREPGTLGKLVYAVHHDAADFGLEQVSEAGRQLLHLAAHVDAIETRILPALRAGTTVVLDRYWWSMEAYGAAGGVSRRLLADMVDLERGAWDNVSPAAVILVDRDAPLREEPMDEWRNVRAEYQRIAERESAIHPVIVLENNGALDAAAEGLRRALRPLGA